MKAKKVVAALRDVQQVQSYPFPFIHPEELEMTDYVNTYGAVIDSYGNIVNEMDFISYEINLEVS